MKSFTQFFLAVTFFAGGAVHAQSPIKSFALVQSMHYKDGVDLSEFGVPRNPIIYEAKLLPLKTSDEIVEGAALKSLVDGIELGRVPTVVDIERWKFYTEDEAERQTSREKLLAVIKKIRAVRPEMKLGFYGIVPTRTYWPLVDKNRKAERQGWDKLNKRAMEDFIPYVDAVFPSLYTLYDDADGWKNYAEETLRVARGFNKPVYCFLWPKFNVGNTRLEGKYVPADFWALELDTCYKYADGIVIWNYEPEKSWDPQAEWWLETLKFMKAHGIK